MKRPDFYVVGAPKSGTTSLYYYLKDHPGVFLPRRKELLYFCNDLHFFFPLLSEQQFLSYYREAAPEKPAGEVSVWNLMSAGAAENIYRFNPEARIVIILRQPVQMLYALHSNHVFNNNEEIKDFSEALNAEAERQLGKRISPSLKGPVEGLFYSQVAAYAPQVSRYYERFGRERVHVMLFDDLVADVQKAYTLLLRFLDLDDSVLPDFKVYNASKTTRSQWLRQFTVAAPGWVRGIGRSILPHQSKGRDRLMQWLWKINTREKQRPPMDSALYSNLLEQLMPGIEALEQTISKDLSVWKAPLE